MPKSAPKRKIISRQGTNLKKKRKETWSVEDLPPLGITNIDLDTPPHLLTSTSKSIKSQNEQLAKSTGSENDTYQMANNNDVRTLENLIYGDEANHEKSISGYYATDVEDDEQGEDEARNLRCRSSLSPTAGFQNEKKNVDSFATGENKNNEQRGEISRQESKGEEIMALQIEVLNSPMLTPQSNRIRFADNESISNLTLSSLDEYRENGIESDSSEESIQESLHTVASQHVKSAEKINIMELINGGNIMWEEVIQRYKEDGKLSKKHRKAMCEAIVQYARVKKIFLDYDAMEDISLQICKVFPTEIPTTYFSKMGKTPSGQLYNLFHRKRTEDTKEEKSRAKPEETLLEPTESLDILKDDGHDDNVYIQMWKETFVYRQKKILKYKSYDDFISEWPIIERPIGSILINIDFKKIYKKRSLTSHNWNLFFANNWRFFTQNVNKKGLRFCKKVHELKESPSKDAAYLMILHYMLPPAYGGHKWKPTCITSQNTFLKFIKDEDMDKEIENRNEECTLRGIKWHPYIIGQGSSKRKIKHFYVVIHNTKIKVDSFLSALDMCMKVFILLNIPYPPESRAVWILVNKIFYNIKVDNLMTSRILQLLHNLN